jgi:hypothetical protein
VRAPTHTRPHRVSHCVSFTVSLTVSLSLCLSHCVSHNVSFTISLSPCLLLRLLPCVLSHRVSHTREGVGAAGVTAGGGTVLTVDALGPAAVSTWTLAGPFQRYQRNSCTDPLLPACLDRGCSACCPSAAAPPRCRCLAPRSMTRSRRTHRATRAAAAGTARYACCMPTSERNAAGAH